MPLIAPPTLSEQLADHLTDRIVRGDLPPGARLPEAELAQEMNVSTNSLREAFRLVEKRHLIEIQPRKGARVCLVEERQVRDLYDFLFMLLGELAARAARAWQGNQLDDLVSLLPVLERQHAEDDIAGAHGTAFEVVSRALRFAGNDYLAGSIRDLLPLLQRYSYIALQEEMTEFDVSLEIFRRLMADVFSRNAEAATADIREYGANQCRIVLGAIAKRAVA